MRNKTVFMMIFSAAFAFAGCSKENISEPATSDIADTGDMLLSGVNCTRQTVHYTSCATFGTAFSDSWNVGELDKHAFAPCGAVPICDGVYEHSEVVLFLGGGFFDWAAGYPNVTPAEQDAIIDYAFDMGLASPPLCPTTGEPKDIVNMDFIREASIPNHWSVFIRYACCAGGLPD